jgi:CheY-like chemotaxis protein
MKLLIVEDNPEMRRLMKRMLGGFDTEISECEDGSEVIASYARIEPDWVLMDITMKDVDGLTATRQLLARWPDARVLMVTNHTDEMLRSEARAAGARGYVLKENLIEVRQMLHLRPTSSH